MNTLEQKLFDAIKDIFNIPDTDETGFRSHVLVDPDADETRGSVSIYTREGMIIEAKYSALQFAEHMNTWYVSLSDVQMHDDPIQFEDDSID